MFCSMVLCCVVLCCVALCRDFTSAHTIRVESGLSHVMEQYDRNFKVQQLMGSKVDVPSPSSKSNPIGPSVKRNISMR